jgi:hypothetical protein
MTAIENGSGDLELIGWLVAGNTVTRPRAQPRPRTRRMKCNSRS